MKKITKDMAEIYLSCEPEETDIRGNAMASGNDDWDREVEETIINDLRNGNVWAWCVARVNVSYKGLEADEFLGACSYAGEDDFRQNSGYYDDMVREALDTLNEKAERLYKELAT